MPVRYAGSNCLANESTLVRARGGPPVGACLRTSQLLGCTGDHTLFTRIHFYPDWMFSGKTLLALQLATRKNTIARCNYRE